MAGDLVHREPHVGNWECAAGAGMLYMLQTSPLRHYVSQVSRTGSRCDKSLPVECWQRAKPCNTTQHFALLPPWFSRIRIHWLGPRYLHIMICDPVMELLNFLDKADGKACPLESECWLGDPGQGCPSLPALAPPPTSFIKV